MITPERWRRLEPLVDAALTLDADRREAYYREACGDDAELRRELEALVRVCEAEGGLPDTPAAAAYAALLPRGAPVPALLGDRYRIGRVLGRGGMATVYLANDEKHRRQVAVKVLHADVAHAIGARRFRREIDVAARLSHPHVLPLHDSGQAAGLLYYVMPYVAGESLRDRLRRGGRLPPAEAARIAREVALALDYAHRQGVIHRDVKPENVLLADGHAVVADFGIARAVSASSAAEEGTLTGTGLVLGTPAYLSPEQAAGQAEVDGRSDVYALGCVLHEMLTGRAPFDGDTPQAVIARRLVEPPPDLRDADGVPDALAAVVSRAMATVPGGRYATAGEMAEALDAAAAALPASRSGEGALLPGARPGPARGFVRHLALRWGAAPAALAAAAALGAVLVHWERAPLPETAQRQVTFTGDVMSARVSPDGQFLAVVARGDSGQLLQVREVGGASSVELARSSTVAQWLGWSADGRLVTATLADGRASPQAYEIPRLGGTPMPLPKLWAITLPATTSPHLLAWGLDARAVIFQSRATPTRASVVVRDSAGWLSGVAEHPSGRALAAAAVSEALSHATIVRVPADSAIRAAGGSHVVPRDTLVDTVGTIPVMALAWAPNGRALYYLLGERGRRTADLWVLPTDDAGRRAGRPSRVARDLGVRDLGGGQLSLAPDGRTLYYARSSDYANLVAVPAADTAAAPRALTSGTSMLVSPVISPSGDRVAYIGDRGGLRDVFIVPVAGGAPQQVTTHGLAADAVAWSPDGDAVAYGVRRGGTVRVAITPLASPTQLRVLDSVFFDGVLAWAPGREILVRASGAMNLVRVDPRSGATRPLLPPDSARLGWFGTPYPSPDGSRLVVGWNGARGRGYGVHVIDASGRSARRVYAGRGLAPVGWAADGGAVLAAGEGTNALWELPLDGSAPRRVRPLPRELGGAAEFIAGGRWLVGLVSTVAGDVWAVENLPATRR
jgi:Tol biopolymer transport system component